MVVLDAVQDVLLRRVGVGAVGEDVLRRRRGALEVVEGVGGAQAEERDQQARYHVLAQENSGRAAVGDIFASTDVKKLRSCEEAPGEV